MSYTPSRRAPSAGPRTPRAARFETLSSKSSRRRTQSSLALLTLKLARLDHSTALSSNPTTSVVATSVLINSRVTSSNAEATAGKSTSCSPSAAAMKSIQANTPSSTSRPRQPPAHESSKRKRVAGHPPNVHYRNANPPSGILASCPIAAECTTTLS